MTGGISDRIRRSEHGGAQSSQKAREMSTLDKNLFHRCSTSCICWIQLTSTLTSESETDRQGDPMIGPHVHMGPIKIENIRYHHIHPIPILVMKIRRCKYLRLSLVAFQSTVGGSGATCTRNFFELFFQNR